MHITPSALSPKSELKLALITVLIAGLATRTFADWDSADPRVIPSHHTLAVQDEPGDPDTGRYDWGPSVMRDGDIYRMWWVRLGGERKQRHPWSTRLPDGEPFEFTYPDWGDRIYYAESHDGRTWNLNGPDYSGPVDAFGPDAEGPMMVLAPAETGQQIHHVGCPSVIKVDGVFYMYYEAPSAYVVNRDKSGKPTVEREYQNQVFLATSSDGRRWQRYPDHDQPRPIIAAPRSNLLPTRRRYGLGQPSACLYQDRFVLHFVDSCTGLGDFIIRMEADNPRFERPRRSSRSLRDVSRQNRIPPGAVARFAQTDVKPLGDVFYLLRPAYQTGNLGILASRDGVFAQDADARAPQDVFPHIRLDDPRGDTYRECLFPRFVTDSEGKILPEAGRVVFFYSSGLGFKEKAYTWDLRRSEILLDDLPNPMR